MATPVILLADIVDQLPSPLLIGLLLGMATAGLLVYWYVWPKRTEPPQASAIEIAINPLVPAGPKSLVGPEVRVYHVPVRIVAVVVAAAGRSQVVLDEETLRRMMENFLPRMMQVIRAHRPDFYRWPGQLSTQGFVQRFFAQAKLPAEGGQGTPWLAVAGRITYQGHGYLIGLVCCADEDNPLGQIVVESTQQWADIVRIH